MNVLEQWKYVREVILPAAIKDAETNPNNPWYKTYQNLDWSEYYKKKP